MNATYGHGCTNHGDIFGVTTELIRMTAIILLEHTKSEGISYKIMSVLSKSLRA